MEHLLHGKCRVDMAVNATDTVPGGVRNLPSN